MASYFRAVAVDFDGTLTLSGALGPRLRAALARTRGRGVRLVLATGRMLPDLRRQLPDVDDLFDAVVAENGGVLALPGPPARRLAAPVAGELAAVLRAGGVPVTAGEVLLAAPRAHDGAVFDGIRRLGLEAQIIHNRGELMVLPSGVSKASGVDEALAELGVSHHSTIAIGDAENDHSLLDACEVGVAVANAVDSLKAHADLVLSRPAGEGVAELLEGPLLDGRLRIHPRRWRITLGRTPRGLVRLPASQMRIVISGVSGGGKSYLAGLIAERIVELGYSICVLDPEGDHEVLSALRGVVALGGGDGLPPPGQVARVIQHRLGSVVVDLSLVDEDTRAAYSRQVLAELAALRAGTGLPHWIFVDEAHLLGRDGEPVPLVSDPSQTGLCLVSYCPDELGVSALDQRDVTLVASPGGQASLRRQGGPDEVTVFEPAARKSAHVRHWHKYAQVGVAAHKRFAFRDAGALTGAQAGSLEQLHRELEHCPAGAIDHHRQNHDFARWVREILRDRVLAESIQAIESSPVSTETVRGELRAAIAGRYLADPGQPAPRAGVG